MCVCGAFDDVFCRNKSAGDGQEKFEGGREETRRVSS